MGGWTSCCTAAGVLVLLRCCLGSTPINWLRPNRGCATANALQEGEEDEVAVTKSRCVRWLVGQIRRMLGFGLGGELAVCALSRAC